VRSSSRHGHLHRVAVDDADDDFAQNDDVEQSKSLDERRGVAVAESCGPVASEQ